MFKLKDRVAAIRGSGQTDDFYSYVSSLNQAIKVRMESDEMLTRMAERALLGEREAVLFALNEAERHLRDKPFVGHLPAAYKKLTVHGAVFQEWIGFGPVHSWFYDPEFSDSPQLQIVGRKVFFTKHGKNQPFPYSFVSTERVEKFQRALIRHDPNIRLGRDYPSAEFKMDDPLLPGRFIRVAIWVPERVWDGFTTITFRRQIMDTMNFDEQAGTGLIPHEAVPMFRALVKTYPNIVVSGPVNSGKTTFANSLVYEQLQASQESLGVVMIEKHPESALPLTVQGHRFIPIRASNSELMQVGIQSLRHDPDVVYMSEMRWTEWQFYNFAGEKGYRGLVGTYHTQDAEDVPYQAAFAVYANAGGSLKGHLVSSLKSCELVAVLESTEHRRKRLVRLSEIQFENDEVTAHDWMRYDYDSDQWQYSPYISQSLYHRMKKKDRTAAEMLKCELSKLSSQSIIKQPATISLKARAVLRGPVG